ncbi:MAG TPA: maleylpyruvate isomerase family mycothiol-dependent enzyme [Acidimicrobiales bacterium]|nr:maleylpyruvate isomerase family mycothiol-dependent enzyme [Acidimicrobiales bacterium]
MTLSRSDVIPGLVTELEAFGALIAALDATAWAAPTRCAGWSVGDVAGHVVGSIADVVGGRLEGLGSPEATAREVAERRGKGPGDLVTELTQVTKLAAEIAGAFDDASWELPAPGGYDGTLGQGVEALWYDTYLHADDIRAALGAPSLRGPGLRASVHHVALELSKAGWGPATLAFDGIEPVDVGGGGPEHTGDALEFVLVATGRSDAGALGPDGPLNIYA